MTVFRAATLRTFFFVFHAGAKELNHGIHHHSPVSDVSQAICLHYVLFRLKGQCPSYTIILNDATVWGFERPLRSRQTLIPFPYSIFHIPSFDALL